MSWGNIYCRTWWGDFDANTASLPIPPNFDCISGGYTGQLGIVSYATGLHVGYDAPTWGTLTPDQASLDGTFRLISEVNVDSNNIMLVKVDGLVINGSEIDIDINDGGYTATLTNNTNGFLIIDAVAWTYMNTLIGQTVTFKILAYRVPTPDFEAIYRVDNDNDTIKLFNFSQDVTVDTGDGTPPFQVVANTDYSHTYATAGHYTVKVDFSAPITSFINTFRDAINLIEVISLDTSNATTAVSAWSGCTGLTSFPVLDFSSMNNIGYTWYNCSGLLSFPNLNTSNVTAANNTWYNCSGLTSFPDLDFSNNLRIEVAWYGCSSLTSFPVIDTSLCDNFSSTWRNCSSITSFPSLDFSNGEIFTQTWRSCSNLTFIDGLDFSSLTDGTIAFNGCTALTSPPTTGTAVRDGDNATVGVWTPLTTAQVDAYLINAVGQTDGVIDLSGNHPRSSASDAAVAQLISDNNTVITS